MATEQQGNPRVRGYCPQCRGETLFLGNNGYVTCSVIGCKDPGAAHDLLADTEAQGLMTTIRSVRFRAAAQAKQDAFEELAMNDGRLQELQRLQAVEIRYTGLMDRLGTEVAGRVDKESEDVGRA